ncbi:diaminopimelate epimerase [Nitratidesulfovibrio sp. HK-II]|jgi:diaminopimelate epimerase|uniref:diaminopimelate epimerase n=1 Tax=Nitratidesulfovibrio sp. HK-II TaxID=2009266 RepID=UPI000E2E4DA4|nr:diaminopimelate epimerase [Nitratidesulfovibrio sp. HK-II]GBO95732.1 diaminopimelate epimerase [Nitratidesulfovibrio sp. HK-II]HCG05050.1 diaminopimelate epimerase [Desulfovibrio sp.]
MSGKARTVPIHKLHGCGNDFVFIDNRALRLPLAAMPDWARAVCRRAFGVGADGLVFLDETPKDREGDYIWHFYNADGSRAEMCGNASRCAALLAVELGFAGPKHVFGTDAGLIRAEADVAAGMAKVELTPPRDLALGIELDLGQGREMVHFVNTGVPHAVVFQRDASAVDVRTLGAALRRHAHFAPAGTNANFAQVIDRRNIHLRTFERGVEDETYACGTGAAAGAFIAHALGLTESTVNVRSSGGEILGISIEGGSVFLSGKAVRVFSGEMFLEGLGLALA